jgi:ankyrin repeat protein
VRANVCIQDFDGDTPLHIATRGGYVNVVRVLLDAGVIIETTNHDGWTPLRSAISYTRIDVARLLIDRGAKLSNIKLDTQLPTIPDWVNLFIASRSICRTDSIVLIGIHKYHRTNITGNNDINVLKLIGKHIWSI